MPKRPVVGVMSSLPLDGNPQLMMMTRGQQGGQPYRLDPIAAADQYGEDRGDRRAGHRSRHPGAAGRRGAEPVGQHAIRHRPVRDARRPADGDGRSLERGDGLAAEPVRHAADRYPFGPEEAVRRLGHPVRSEPGGRRPDRRVAGARAGGPECAGGELCRVVQYPRRHQSQRPGDGRSAAGDRGVLRVHRQGS